MPIMTDSDQKGSGDFTRAQQAIADRAAIYAEHRRSENTRRSMPEAKNHG